MKRRFLIFIMILASVWAFSTTNVYACSCIVNGTVDEEFADSPNVVILKVNSVERRPESEEGYGYDGIKTTTLSVEKVFKGSFKVGEAIKFAQGGGADCVWTFGEESIGEEFLFYLGRAPRDSKQFAGVIASTTFGKTSSQDNVWAASTCSRSGNIKRRTLDLKYLNNLQEVKGRSRLSGNVTQEIESALASGLSEYKKLANKNVRITGNGKDLTIKTDENGDYEIYDLQAGTYNLTLESLPGYKLSPFDWEEENPVKVKVKSKRHSEKNFTFYIDNSISGRFYDTNGKLLKDVCLDLYPADGEKSRWFRNFDCTNEQGEFKFDEIPAGNYIIVVNRKNAITAREPFGTFYYPDKLKKEDAKAITIAAGQHIKDIIITAPATQAVVTVSGVLLYEDGKPVADESVEYFSSESLKKQEGKEFKSEDSRTTTDKDGRFTLRVLKGQKGKIVGSMITYLGRHKNCSKMDKLILSKIKNPNGITVTDLETPAVEFDAEKDIFGLELRFPFPYCKVADIE